MDRRVYRLWVDSNVLALDISTKLKRVSKLNEHISKREQQTKTYVDFFLALAQIISYEISMKPHSFQS